MNIGAVFVHFIFSFTLTLYLPYHAYAERRKKLLKKVQKWADLNIYTVVQNY